MKVVNKTLKVGNKTPFKIILLLKSFRVFFDSRKARL